MIKRKTIAALIFLLIVAIWAVGLGRYILIAKAKDKANEFAVLDNADPENVVRKVTAAVHKKFYRHKDATDDNSAPLLMRLRPYLTNSRLPEFIKIPEGAIETLYARGWCDNAVRMTRFILLQHGLQTRQWNIVTPVGAHAALVVDIHRKIVIFSDPFYGVFSKNPEAGPAGFIPLSKDSSLDFYKDMNRVAMAAQGDELIIRAPVSAPLILGEVNGRADDVKETAMQSRLFPHWDYMGHKYDRAWKRILEAQEPLYVTFILTQSVDQGVVTSNKSPAISGKILKWELEKGEELIFTDGLAKLSFLRLNSYIPVDQIIIEAR